MYRPLAKAILAFSIVVTTAVSVFISCSSAEAAQPVKVFLSGRQVEFDVPPIVDKGGILVPARAIFEALGAAVDWDPDRETVSAYKDGTVVRLILNEPRAYVNNGSVKLAVPPRMINSRVVVPVRFVGEVFGAAVSWDSKNSAINLSFKQPVDYKKILIEEVFVFAENLKVEDLEMLPDGRFLGEADIIELDPRRITDPFYVYDYDNIAGYTYGNKMLFLYDLQEKTVKEIAYFDWEARGNQAKYWNFTYLSDGRVLAQNSIKPNKKARDENYVYKLIDPYTGDINGLRMVGKPYMFLIQNTAAGKPLIFRLQTL